VAEGRRERDDHVEELEGVGAEEPEGCLQAPGAAEREPPAGHGSYENDHCLSIGALRALRYWPIGEFFAHTNGQVSTGKDRSNGAYFGRRHRHTIYWESGRAKRLEPRLRRAELEEGTVVG
jgi:hypothetical protein